MNQFVSAKRRAGAVAIFLAAVGPMAVAGAARAGDDFWTQAAGGAWEASANWSLGAPPGQPGFPNNLSDNADFNLSASSPYTVSLAAGHPVNDLNVLSDNVVFNLNNNVLTGPTENGNFNVAASAGQVGSLRLNGPGTYHAHNIAMTIGANGGTGNLTIDHSTITIEYFGIRVGSGSMAIQNSSNFAFSAEQANMTIGGGAAKASVFLDNSRVSVPGPIQVLSNGSLSISNQANVIAVGDTLTVAGGAGNARASVSVDNASYSATHGIFDSISNGTFSATNGASVYLDAASNNSYDLGIGDNGVLTASGAATHLTIHTLGGGVIVGSDGASTGTSTFHLDTGAVGVVDKLKIAASGNLQVKSGAVLTVTQLDLSTAGSYDLAGGAITLSDKAATLTAANLILPNTSILMGIGTLTGNLTSSGTVSPGNAPLQNGSGEGRLTVNGNYVQNAGGTLDIGIVGPGYKNPNPDKLAVLGSASWGGTLNVVPVKNPDEQVGNQFQLFTWGSETGAFSTVNLPVLPGGELWDSSTLYTDGTIKIIAQPTSIWTNPGGGTWNLASHWQNNSVPDGVAGAATLGAAASGPFNLTLDGNRTLGELVFSSTNSYTLSSGTPASSRLILDQGGNYALVNVLDGNHVINAPVQLNSPTTVSIARMTSTLTINGSISGAGSLSEAGAGTLVLAGSNSYAGPTNISSGTMVVNGAGGLPTGKGISNDGVLIVNGGNVVGAINSPGQIGSLKLGATLQIAAGNGPSLQKSLSINGGLLDLTNNSLTLAYGADPSPNSTIRNYIAGGYNSGGSIWAGTVGITSSSAAADKAHHSIAFTDGADGVVTNLPAGVSSVVPTGGALPAGNELVTYALAGDANLDGRVDFSDFIILSNHFGAADNNWDHGNFNYDPSVDFSDFIVLSNNFGAGTSIGNGAGATLQELAQYNSLAASFGISQSQIAAWDATVATLPEPTTLGIVGIAAFELLRRRRRKANVQAPNFSCFSAG